VRTGKRWRSFVWFFPFFFFFVVVVVFIVVFVAAKLGYAGGEKLRKI